MTIRKGFPDGWCVLQAILMTTFKTNDMNELTKKLQQVMVPKSGTDCLRIQ